MYNQKIFMEETPFSAADIQWVCEKNFVFLLCGGLDYKSSDAPDG